MKEPHNKLTDEQIERFVEGAQLEQGDAVDRLFDEIDQLLAKSQKETNGQ